MFFVELGGNLHAVEDTMVHIFLYRCKHHFAIGCQLKVDILAVVVGEGQAAYLSTAVLEDSHFGLRFDAVVDTQEGHLIARKAHMIAFRHHIQRRIGVAPKVVLPNITDIDVCAVVVGGDLTVTAQHDVTVAREATAAVVHQHCVLAIADDAQLGHIGNGIEVTSITLRLYLRIAVALVLRYLEVNIRPHLRLLLQQGFHGTHSRLLHKVALQAVVAEIIGQRGQNHTLMVGVVRLHGHMILFVITLVESEVVVHFEGFELLHVLIHRTVVDTDGHQRAVGRHHDAVGRSVLELQIGNTESMVFVVLGVIEFVVGRLRDAPRRREK